MFPSPLIIVAGRQDKSNPWEVNTEQDYHESKSSARILAGTGVPSTPDLGVLGLSRGDGPRLRT